MSIVKEYLCKAHGEVESSDGTCPHGCPSAFLTRQIRTPPAYRRSGNMRWVDGQAKAIAAENGLSDLKADPKANISALEASKRNQAAQWLPMKQAAPGFSRDPNAVIPKITGEQLGTVTQRDVLGAVPNWSAPKLPPPRPLWQGQPKD